MPSNSLSTGLADPFYHAKQIGKDIQARRRQENSCASWPFLGHARHRGSDTLLNLVGCLLEIAMGQPVLLAT